MWASVLVWFSNSVKPGFLLHLSMVSPTMSASPLLLPCFMIAGWLLWFLTSHPHSTLSRRRAETFFFLKILFYFFIFREGGREGEKERERNISVWLPLAYPLLGTWLATQACALTWNRTGDPHPLRRFTGQHLIHWAAPARAETLFSRSFPQMSWVSLSSIGHLPTSGSDWLLAWAQQISRDFDKCQDYSVTGTLLVISVV